MRDMIMYVRDKKNNPVGVFVFQQIDETIGTKPVVCVGWSKANRNHEKFDKAFGKTVARTRSDKAINWVSKANNETDIGSTVVDSEHFKATTKTVPYVVKNDLNIHLNKAKISLGIHEETIFVFPIIEEFAELQDCFSSDAKPKLHRKTRYSKIIH